MAIQNTLPDPNNRIFFLPYWLPRYDSRNTNITDGNKEYENRGIWADQHLLPQSMTGHQTGRYYF